MSLFYRSNQEKMIARGGGTSPQTTWLCLFGTWSKSHSTGILPSCPRTEEWILILWLQSLWHFIKEPRGYMTFLMSWKKMKQDTKIQVNKSCVQSFEGSTVRINLPLSEQRQRSSISCTVTKGGFGMRRACLSRFLMHINLVRFGSSCYLEDLIVFIIIQNTYLILFYHFFHSPLVLQVIILCIIFAILSYRNPLIGRNYACACVSV